MTRAYVSLVSIVFVFCCFGFAASPDIVRVDGGQISGTTDGGVRVFKGIPFAAPPIGDLRWKAPQGVVAWNGVKAADTFAPQCVRSEEHTSELQSHVNLV